jgi:hypothetical protein
MWQAYVTWPNQFPKGSLTLGQGELTVQAIVPGAGRAKHFARTNCTFAVALATPIAQSLRYCPPGTGARGARRARGARVTLGSKVPTDAMTPLGR